MKNQDKKAIAATYHIGYTYLESWIESISYVRNLCAHYGRLYNAKLAKTPMLYRQDKAHEIPNAKIFGVLVCIGRLVPRDEHWIEFVENLDGLIRKYESVKVNTMGFPQKWKELLLEK